MLAERLTGGLDMSRKAVVAVAVLVAAWVELVVASGAGAQAPVPTVRVPDRLAARSDESLAMIVAARGVQVYECREGKKGDAAIHEWALLGPEAELYDARGSRVGRHAGSVWEAADGSRVQGTVKDQATGPSGASIPWLLVTTRTAGPAGAFSNVTSIQRVNTVGGVPPSTGCDEKGKGKRARVSYTADYYMYTRR
jgi:hypothetical protein